MRRGFTLIEMVVSLGIFSAVMLISLAALLAVSQGQKEAIAAQNNFDNLRFSLEAMTREIKTGKNLDCAVSEPGKDCIYPNGRSDISFLNNEGNTVKYCLAQNQLVRSTGAGTCGSPPKLPITAKEVKITKFAFFVSGAANNDSQHPFITILIEAETAGFKTGEIARFNLQTSVSVRAIAP